MPRGDAYASSLFGGGLSKTDIRSKAINSAEATSLGAALNQDLSDFYFSAWVSFIDAIRGIESNSFTWATVKLYYSTFYALRSALAYARICAFHVGRSSFYLKAVAGESPVSCADGGTHKSVIATFEREQSTHALLSQQIDLMSPLTWLMDQRETANYRRGRFVEPDVPDELDFVNSVGIRKAVTAYLADSTHLHTFDPDHALMAFPLKALQLIGDDFLTGAVTLSVSDDERAFLKAHCSDQTGNIAPLATEMKRIGLLT